MDNLGVNFAPTSDNAAMGQKNAALTGVPQAIQVISMALPRVIGARPVAPAALLGSPGSGGNMGIQSALLQTILRTLGLHGGTAGPDPGGPLAPPQPGVPGSPYTPPSDPPIPTNPGPITTVPRVVTQPNAPPPSPFPRGPLTPPQRGPRF